MKRISILLMMLMAIFAPLAMNAQSRSTLTVYGDNTTTNEYVPIYGYWADSKSKCEFIIPSEKIAAMTGGRISAMKFYLSSSDSHAQISTTFNVFVKEVSATTLTAYTGSSDATTVFNGTITIAASASNIELDIPFTSDYVYNGGNLLVGFYQTGSASYNHTYWTGETQSANTAWSGYGSNAGSGQKFLPKTTFTYEVSTTPNIILPATATVITGSTTTLTATALNVTGTPSISYTTSNASIATVTGSGTTATVTGVSAGTATITATMIYNSNTYTSTCDVTVEDPSYCTPGTGNYDNDGIYNVTFGTNGVVVNNTVSGIDYGDYSNLVGAVEAGTTGFEVAITYKTSYTYGTIIWVDWNKNYTFEGATEVVYAGQSGSTNPTTLTATFDIPSTTAAGDYRMRIIGADMALDSYTGSLSAAANADACGSYNYSTCHDYTLRVISVACPVPTNLTASNVTPTTATLGWSGEAENYNVQYRKVAYEQSLFSEGFENGIPSTWTTIDSDNDGNNWLALSEVSSVYTSYSGTMSSWAHGGSNAATSPSYANGAGCMDSDQWLISPQVPLQGTLKFYAASTHSDQDAYEVLLSTTGTATTDFTTTLQAMKNAPYALNDGTDDWEEVTIDLSSYSGQGYIAIHHVSSCMYFLVIDDFEIYETVAEAWTPATAENGATSIDIDELDAEAEYEWQVQADCGSEDGVSSWSAITTFTTPSACAAPTALSAEVAGNAAELSWTGFTETYNVQYRQILDPDPTAPATIIFTADAIWSDGSGYQMLLDADATAYAEVYEAGLFGSDCDVASTIYDAFEYKLPNNADPSCTSTNIVAGSSVTVQVPAGTYDFIITNPTPDDRIWIAAGYGNVGGHQDDYVFEGGKIYEFHVYMGSNGYDATDVTISNPTTAWTLVEGVTNPYTLTSLNPQATYEVQVQGVNCSGNNNTDWSASTTFTTPEFYTKDITAYNGDGGWYLIASPVTANVTPSADNGFLTSAYDLYYFNQDGDSEGNEWINFEDTNDGGYNIVNGQGYLYASSTNTTLVFTGSAYNGNGEVELTYSTDNADANMHGWNLVGNPFAQTAYINMPFYTLDGGSEYVEHAAGDEIQRMQGILVHTDAATTLTFSTTAPTKGSMVTLNVSQDRAIVDRAIVSFGEGRQLPKFQINPNHTKVYMPVDGKDYAVANAENEGEMPVNFKAESNGTYTLSFNTENVEFNYLHLIDNMTGNDIDLLSTPSYSFEAKTTDYASRFRLVFATGASEDNFAFMSNGNLIVSNEGEATLQVIDVNGRIVRSESISGSASVNMNTANGVYVIRLINGENVKTQKMVVR